MRSRNCVPSKRVALLKHYLLHEKLRMAAVLLQYGFIPLKIRKNG